MDLPPCPSGFRRRLQRAQLAGRILLVGVVAAGLLGFWGSGGPLARQQRHVAGGGSVELPRFARFATSFQVMLELGEAPGERRVHLSSSLLKQLRIEGIQPQPSSAVWRRDGLALVFPPGTRRVRMDATADRAGWVGGLVELAPDAPEAVQLWVHP